MDKNIELKIACQIPPSDLFCYEEEDNVFKNISQINKLLNGCEINNKHKEIVKNKLEIAQNNRKELVQSKIIDTGNVIKKGELLIIRWLLLIQINLEQ